MILTKSHAPRPCFDDFTDTTPAFGWEYQAPHESPSTQQSPPAECPPDDLDFDTLLQGLEGFEGDGENFGGFDAEQSHGTFEGSFGACEGTLGSLDSILPSDFHFPMGLGDESPRSSDLDCMTSPPGDEECPRSALPRKRKGKAKQTRCAYCHRCAIIEQEMSECKVLDGCFPPPNCHSIRRHT